MSASDKHAGGSFGLTVMPFPAFNPWNWGALGPAHMLAASLNASRFALDTWRISADAYRAAMRQQQDVVMAAFNTRLNDTPEQPAEPHVGDVMSPLLAVTRAYADMGKTILASNQEMLASIGQVYRAQDGAETRH